MSVFKRLYDILNAEWQDLKLPKEGSSRSGSQTSQRHQSEQDDPGRHDTDTQDHLSAETRLELDYYANLEVEPGASFATIKRSYRLLLAKYHPDRYHDDQRRPYAEDITRRLNEAYQYFEQKEKRKS